MKNKKSSHKKLSSTNTLIIIIILLLIAIVAVISLMNAMDKTESANLAYEAGSTVTKAMLRLRQVLL